MDLLFYSGWTIFRQLTDGWVGEIKRFIFMLLMCYTYPAMTERGSYNLPKVDPENIQLMWHTPCVLLPSVFIYQKLITFAVVVNADKNYIFILNF